MNNSNKTLKITIFIICKKLIICKKKKKKKKKNDYSFVYP